MQRRGEGSRSLVNTVVAGLVALGFLLASSTSAQPKRVESLILKVFPMTHQSAREALPLVDALLSSGGSVSLQQEDNALVIRDRASVIEKLKPLLAEFDHPPTQLTLVIHLLRATRTPVGAGISPPVGVAGLPEELVAALGNILNLNRYEALGSAELLVTEGQSRASEVGSDYSMSFDVGTILRGRHIKLSDFRVERKRGSLKEQVYHSSINLKRGRPAFVTISRDAASASGLVVAFLWAPGTSSVSPVLQGVR